MSSTLRHFAFPNLAAGVSLVSTAVSWTWPASYTEIVPANTITSTFYISALTASHTSNVTIDTRLYLNFSLGKGTAGSETEIIQFTSTLYVDTNSSYWDSLFYVLPEAVEVAANTRIAGRVTRAEAVAETYSNVKILYQAV